MPMPRSLRLKAAVTGADKANPQRFIGRAESRRRAAAARQRQREKVGRIVLAVEVDEFATTEILISTILILERNVENCARLSEALVKWVAAAHGHA